MQDYRIIVHRDRFSLAYNDPGKVTKDNRSGRVRIALGTDDRGLAEARAREIWRQRTTPASERVEDLWPSYVADRQREVSRKDRFDSLWKALAPHFGHRLATAITRDDCRAYYKARKLAGKSNSTVKTELEFLRACLRFHLKKDAPALWMPPDSKPREHYLTREERDRLLDAINTPHVKLFVRLATATGARMTAILDLTWDRVDLEVGTVDLNPAGREITNKRRTTVKLTAQAIEDLRAARPAALTDNVIEYDGKPVKSVKKAIRAASVRSGVKCSPHVFRHTAGVWMANADVQMEKIAQVLGTTLRIAEKHYARYSPSYQQDAIAALE
jgi:integrase